MQIKIRIILILLSLAVIVFSGKIDYRKTEFAGMDLHKYRSMAMASNETDNKAGHPYKYRVLVPYIVKNITTDVDLGFYWLNLIFLLAIPQLLYSFSLLLGLNQIYAFIISWLMIFNRNFFSYLAWNYFQAGDTISYFCVTLGLILLYKRKYILTIPVLLIGTLARESTLLLIPVMITAILFDVKFKTKQKKIAIAVVISLITLVLLIFFFSPQIINNYFIQFLSGMTYKFENPGDVLKRLLFSFSPFSIIIIINFKWFWRELKQQSILFSLAVFTVISLSLGNDIERLLMPLSFTIYYILISVLSKQLNLIENEWKDFSKKSKIFIFFFFALSILSNINQIWGIFLLPDKVWNFGWNLLLSFAGFAIYFCLRKKANQLGLQGNY